MSESYKLCWRAGPRLGVLPAATSCLVLPPLPPRATTPHWRTAPRTRRPSSPPQPAPPPPQSSGKGSSLCVTSELWCGQAGRQLPRCGPATASPRPTPPAAPPPAGRPPPPRPPPRTSHTVHSAQHLITCPVQSRCTVGPRPPARPHTAVFNGKSGMLGIGVKPVPNNLENCSKVLKTFSIKYWQRVIF